MLRKEINIIHLPSWYPVSDDSQNGDFILRHILSIPKFYNNKLFFAESVSGKIDKTIVKDIKLGENVSASISIYKKKSSFFLYSTIRYILNYNNAFYYLKKLNRYNCIMHVHVSYRAGIIAFLLKKSFNIPYIITEHWTFFTEERQSNFNNCSFLMKAILRCIFNGASYVLPVSENLNKRLKSYFPNIKSVVIPNVVDPGLFYFCLKMPIVNSFHFVHVSSLNQLKNPVGIIKVFSSLKAKYERVRLEIVGPASQAFMKTVRDLGYFNDSISFLGQKEHYEVAKLMRESDAFVLFSSSENLPCVIAESLCCGVPVISSSVGGVPEMVDESNGLLVPPGDEDALYNAMESMILNYTNYDRKKISETAQAKYNPDVVGKQIVEVYEKVLSKK